MPSVPKAAAALSFALLIVGIIAGRVYIGVMYDGHVDNESLIEAANYATQTLTTVGYGNWEMPARGLHDESDQTKHLHQENVLTMRAFSTFFTVLGGTFYVFLTGVVISLFCSAYLPSQPQRG